MLTRITLASKKFYYHHTIKIIIKVLPRLMAKNFQLYVIRKHSNLK